MHLNKVIIFLLILLIFSTEARTAEEKREKDDKDIFNIVIENDSFTGSDRDYTSGVRFAWLSSEENMPNWARLAARQLPIESQGNKRISLAFGQSLFAPEDITKKNLIVGDQPYAGWLYGSIGIVSDTGRTLDNVMLTLGMVGPEALGEETQKFVHRFTNSPQPKGWHNQLKNEPGIVFTYERKWRGMYEFSPFGLAADFTPHIGVNLGNINTDASVGATFRLGFDLPADYGPPRIRPSLPGSDFFVPTKELGGYLFTTVGERAVARNIFLDGNSFVDSNSVDKKNFVSSLQVGIAITYDEARISYTQVFMTKEYKTQRNSPEFGALTLSLRF